MWSPSCWVAVPSPDDEPGGSGGDPAKPGGGGTKEKANSPPSLFADMPASAYPKYGPERGIERAAARKWMKENLVGQSVEWTAAVKTVSIRGDDPFYVWLVTDAERLFSDTLTNGFDGGTFFLGTQECQVVIVTAGWSAISRNTCSVPYEKCTAAEADQFRGLKGKTVRFRGRITKTNVGDRAIKVGDFDGNVKRTIKAVSLMLEVAPPSAGWLPAGSQPAEGVGEEGVTGVPEFRA